MSFLQHIPWYLEVAAVFLVMMTVLVAAHEYGHYLFARIFGMGIEEFAIGMGKKVGVWRRKTYQVGPSDVETTEFTFRAFPVGGFVRIKGMQPEEDGSEIHIPGGFYSKAPWKRFLVLLAGPLFSVLAGLAVLIPVFAIYGIQHPTTKLDTLVMTDPAYLAGVRPGDEILSIDGKPIHRYFDLTQTVQASAGKPLSFWIKRGDREFSLTVVPVEREAELLDADGQPTGVRAKVGKIGVIPAFEKQHVALGEAVSEGFQLPVKAIGGVLGFVAHPSTIEDSVGGPATMVDVVARSTEQGMDSLLSIAGLISISVGIMNLLPFPPLDGGQMIVALAEIFRRGRRLSYRVQEKVQNIGLTLVMVLIMGVLFIDFKRFVLPDKTQFTGPLSSASPSPSPSHTP